MAQKRRNILGFKKGVITVIKEALAVKGVTYWFVQCKCGHIRKMETQNILRKTELFLDCLHVDKEKRQALYVIHQNMMLRCYYPCSINYARYGGRGIQVADKWKSFKAFYRDVNHLYIEGMEIDRINNNGNYEPGNIRWVTSKENCRNNRNCKLDYEAVKLIKSSPLSSKELAKVYNVSYSAINRVRKGASWA